MPQTKPGNCVVFFNFVQCDINFLLAKPSCSLHSLYFSYCCATSVRCIALGQTINKSTSFHKKISPRSGEMEPHITIYMHYIYMVLPRSSKNHVMNHHCFNTKSLWFKKKFRWLNTGSLFWLFSSYFPSLCVSFSICKITLTFSEIHQMKVWYES